ncbi:hypothetical protein NMG60_11007130 [Bertholletia excelsa]
MKSRPSPLSSLSILRSASTPLRLAGLPSRTLSSILLAPLLFSSDELHRPIVAYTGSNFLMEDLLEGEMCSIFKVISIEI